MANTTLVICFVLGLSLHLALTVDFSIDLRTGESTGRGDYLTWEIEPYKPSDGYVFNYGLETPCLWQAVLRLTFHKKLRRRAEIKMAFDNSTLFSFNLGDSITNDGNGGDDGTQSNDAEVNAYDSNLLVAGKSLPNSNSGSTLYYRRNYLQGNLTMNVANRFIETVNDVGVVHYASRELFALRGQADAKGEENMDLYLSMNRVIKNRTYRQGAGLCSVDITWHQN